MFPHIPRSLHQLSVTYLAAILACCAAGCEKQEPASSSGGPRAPTSVADPLTASDLDRFLVVLDSQSGMLIPEFTAPDDDEFPDHSATADELIGAFRDRVRQVFDTERQGALWNRDPDWSRVLAEQKFNPAEFAALVRSVSCAIMRVRLEKRVDLERLVNNARAEVDRLKQIIDEIDETVDSVRSRDDQFQRTQAVIRLGRGVALLEFAEMVQQVPLGNCTVVRQYSRRLKPLLPRRSSDELLAELEQLGRDQPNRVEHAGFERPAR